MPRCSICSTTQSKLNPRDLCRNCYKSNDADNSPEHDETYWERMGK